MTEQELLRQISIYEDKIWECNQQIKNNNNRIDDYAELKTQTDKATTNFISACSARKSKWENIFDIFAGQGLRINEKMINNQKELFCGPEYEKAKESYCEISRRAMRKIEDLEDENEYLRRKIVDYNARISNCRASISAAKTAATQGDEDD